MEGRIHWPTLIFGALPATYLAFPAALGILFGGFFSLTLKPMAFLILATSILGWVGALSLWSAVRSSQPLASRTARGLALGIAGGLVYAGLQSWSEEAQHRLALWPAWLVLGPITIAAWHLSTYRRAQSQAMVRKASAAQEQDKEEQQQPFPRPPAPGARPLRSETVARVLKALLFGQCVVGLAVAPLVLGDASGWGSLYATLATFPFALAVGLTGIWAFWRFPELRRLSAGVLGLLVAWPWLYALAERSLGAEAASFTAARAAMLLPGLVVLLLPRQVALFVPAALLGRHSFRILVALQATLALLWPALLLWARPWSPELDAAGLWGTASHGIASLAVGTLGATLGYIALFTRAGREHAGIVAIALIASIVVLALSAASFSFVWLLFATASMG